MSASSPLRVIFDTNIWIGERLDELVATLFRRKFVTHIRPDQIGRLVADIRAEADWFEITPSVTACRDPKDSFVLDLCLTGKADYLVTGDGDLLALDPFQGTRIVDYRTF